MTSANLSVGIRTEAAKKAITDLKEYVRNEMKGLILDVNQAALTLSVQQALDKQKYSISIDTGSLELAVGGTVKKALSQPFEVQINATDLTTKVRAAVTAGMAGAATAATGAVGTSTGAMMVDVKNIVTQSAAAAADSMKQALDGALARSGAPTAAGGGGGRRAARVSFRAPGDLPGESWSYAEPVSDAEAHKTRIKERAAQREAEKAAAKHAADMAASKEFNNKLELKAIRDGEKQALRMADENQRSANAAFQVNQRMWKLAQSDAAKAAADTQASANAAFQTNQRVWRINLTEAQRRADDEQRSANAAFQANQRIWKIKQAALKQEEEAAERAARLEVARAYRRARTEVPAELGLNTQGRNIYAAQATARQFGRDRTSEMLGPNAYMLDQVASAHARVETAAKKAGQAHVGVSRAMWDAHSAARGLAGSLGLLWVTWGSTVPIVAAAALGAAVRSVITVGKDLEYQLRFVAVLTDSTSVSLDRFGQAVRGSMTTPVEAAQALRGMAQNGLSLREALAGLPTILNLATAGEMELGAAALGATGVMQAFNLSISDLSRVGDVFAKAAAISNTSVAGMVEAMKQASTVADRYSISIEETAAALAVLAQRNITGSAAGTSFKTMMDDLASPTKKAREALAAIGMEIYDQNKQLKPFLVLMQELRDRFVSLNQEGRNAVISDIFEKRAAKGAIALLSDWDEYKAKFNEIKNQSKGFTQSVADALGDTVEGKIKRLITEFQLSTATAFNQVNLGVANFVDNLRAATASTGFKSFLESLTSSLVSVSRYIIDNHNAVKNMLLTWFAFRVATPAVVASFGLLQAGFNAMTGSALAASTAFKSMWVAITGPLALIGVLAAHFLMVRDNTSKATEAYEAFTNRLEIQAETANRNLVSMQEQNVLLERQIELMYQGIDAVKARQIAEGATKRSELEDQRGQLAFMKARRDEIYEQLKQPFSASGRNAAGSTRDELLRERDDLSRAIPAAEAAARKLEGIVNAAEAAGLRLSNNTALETQLRRVQEINRMVEANKGKYKLFDLPMTVARDVGNPEALKALVDDINARNNKILPGYRRTDGETARLERSGAQRVIEELKTEEARIKSTIKHHEQLDKARYSSDRFGPYMSAVLAEAREHKYMNDLIDLEINMVNRLGQEKATMTDASNRDRIDAEIQARWRSIDSMRTELAHRRELYAIRAAENAFADERKFNNEVRSLGTQDAKALQEINSKFRVKIMDPVEAEGARAELATIERYMQAISKQEMDLVVAKEAANALQREALEADIDQQARKKELAQIAQDNVLVEERRLNVLRQQSQEARAIAGAAARREATYAQTAEAGWDKFWANYVNNAQTSSKLVYDALSMTTTKMTEAFQNFVVTGKLNFRSLVATITSELARMMAAKAMQQLISLAFNFAMSGSGTSTAPSSVGIGSDPFSGFADGGIMTSRGRVPLSYYSSGGIASSPRVAVFAEGRRPEAYVPLPDGRTIPVTMQGGGGGVHVETNVYVSADGSARSETKTSGEDAARLGKMIELAVTSEIVKQQRPGGVLYNTARA